MGCWRSAASSAACEPDATYDEDLTRATLAHAASRHAPCTPVYGYADSAHTPPAAVRYEKVDASPPPPQPMLPCAALQSTACCVLSQPVLAPVAMATADSMAATVAKL